MPRKSSDVGMLQANMCESMMAAIDSARDEHVWLVILTASKPDPTFLVFKKAPAALVALAQYFGGQERLVVRDTNRREIWQVLTDKSIAIAVLMRREVHDPGGVSTYAEKKPH